MDMWLVVVGSIFGNRPTGSGREARVQAKAMHQHTHSHNRRRSFFPPPSPSQPPPPPPPPLNHPPSQADATSVSISINPTRSQGPRVPGWVRSTCYIHVSQEMYYQSNRASLLWVVARYIISPGFRTILQGQEVGVGCMTVTHAGPTLSLIRGGQTDGSSHSLPPSLPVIFLLHGGVAVSPAASEDALKLASLPPSSVPLIPPSPPAKKASSPRFKTLRVHPWMGLVGFTAFASHSWGILLFYEQPSAPWLGTWLRDRTAANRI